MARRLAEKYDFVNNSEVVALAINHPSLERGVRWSTRRALGWRGRAQPGVLEQWLPRHDTILFAAGGCWCAGEQDAFLKVQ